MDTPKSPYFVSHSNGAEIEGISSRFFGESDSYDALFGGWVHLPPPPFGRSVGPSEDGGKWRRRKDGRSVGRSELEEEKEDSFDLRYSRAKEEGLLSVQIKPFSSDAS